MSSFKKPTCKGILRQVFICLRPRTPYPPTLHTVYIFTQGGGGGGVEGGNLKQRERERDNSSQTWVGNTNMTDCIS